MSLKRAFHVLTFATALWAFLALVATGQVHLVPTVLFLALYWLAVLKHRGFRVPLPRQWGWTVVNIIAFSAAIYGWAVLQERMYSVTYFFFYLEINKLLTADKNRDYIQIYALTFFHMLAASVSTESVIFAPVLAVYVMLVVSGMIVFTVKRDAEQAYSIRRWKKKQSGFEPHRLGDEDEDAIRRIANERFADRQFMAWMLGTSIVMVLLGAVIFWAVPRTEVTNFIPGLSRDAEGPRTSGFADNITFGGVGEIQTNPVIVMRAAPDPAYIENRPEFLRIRGTALDYYVGSQWIKSGFVRNSVQTGRQQRVEFPRSAELPARGGKTFRARLSLEPESSGYLFLLDQPIGLQLDETRYLDVDNESQSIRSPNRHQTISYDVEGVIPPELGSLPQPSTPTGEESATGSVEDLPLLLKATSERLAALPKFIRSAVRPQGAEQERGAIPPPYLETPEGLEDMETIERLAREWTAGMTTNHDKAMAIQRRLRTQYEYSLKVDFSNREDHLTQFLTVERSGHCEYFATAMALMLRKLGIPSRIVNGYLTDEWSNTSGRYIIRQEHAHSWVEAIVDDSGLWTTFDPTPASGLGSNRINISLYHHISSLVDAIKVFWYDRFIDYNLNDQRQGMIAFLRALRIGSRMTNQGMSRLRQAWHGESGGGLSGKKVVGLMLLAVALGISAWVALQLKGGKSPVRALRRARHGTRADVKAYLDFVREIERRHPRPASQTPLDFAREVEVKWGGALKGLVPLTQGYYEVRFSGKAWDKALDELLRQVRANFESATHKSGAKGTS